MQTAAVDDLADAVSALRAHAQRTGVVEVHPGFNVNPAAHRIILPLHREIAGYTCVDSGTHVDYSTLVGRQATRLLGGHLWIRGPRWGDIYRSSGRVRYAAGWVTAPKN